MAANKILTTASPSPNSNNMLLYVEIYHVSKKLSITILRGGLVPILRGGLVPILPWNRNRRALALNPKTLSSIDVICPVAPFTNMD